MANMLTLSRLILIPLFIYFMFSSPPQNLMAVIVFVLAALTDFLDGYVARVFNQVTELGKTIDPFVDRIFIVAAIVALYIRDGQPPCFALVILLGRELFVLIGYVYLKLKERKLSVSFLGKMATAFLMTAFALLIVQFKLGLIIFYVGLSLYIISAFHYLLEGIKITFG